MFKKGDKVKIVSCEKSTYWYADKIGKVFEVEGVSPWLGPYIYENLNQKRIDLKSYLVEGDIEFVKEEKEEMQFDMKKEPWYIRVANEQEFNAACDWVKSKGLDFKYSGNYFKGLTAISNYMASDGSIYEYIHRRDVEDDLSEYKEIKLTFKTVIDSVTFPEVKTEQQKQIEELEKTILLAKQQIETLKKGE